MSFEQQLPRGKLLKLRPFNPTNHESWKERLRLYTFILGQEIRLRQDITQLAFLHRRIDLATMKEQLQLLSDVLENVERDYSTPYFDSAKLEEIRFLHALVQDVLEEYPIGEPENDEMNLKLLAQCEVSIPVYSLTYNHLLQISNPQQLRQRVFRAKAQHRHFRGYIIDTSRLNYCDPSGKVWTAQDFAEVMEMLTQPATHTRHFFLYSLLCAYFQSPQKCQQNRCKNVACDSFCHRIRLKLWTPTGPQKRIP